MPLTDAGFEPTSANEYLKTARESFETEVGFAVDWSRDQVLGNLAVIMAGLLGDTSEVAKAIHDQFDPNNATGVQLDNLCSIVGVYRKPPTFSTVTLTITGTNGTGLSPGDLIAEGGGADDSARWILGETVTIAGGSVDAVFTAEVSGEIQAAIGQVTDIVTPVAGVAAVTNAAAADPGEARESDDELRLRRSKSLQLLGSASLRAIRGAVLELDFVTACAVVENTSSAVATVEGISMAPHSVSVVVLPTALTDEQKATVAETIYDQVAAGIETVGTSVSTTVIGADGVEKPVNFNYAADLAVVVVVATTPESGFVAADYEADIQAIIADRFDDILNGDDLTDFDVFGWINDVEGLKRATVTLNGVNTVDATVAERLTLSGTAAVS